MEGFEKPNCENCKLAIENQCPVYGSCGNAACYMLWENNKLTQPVENLADVAKFLVQQKKERTKNKNRIREDAFIAKIKDDILYYANGGCTDRKFLFRDEYGNFEESFETKIIDIFTSEGFKIEIKQPTPSYKTVTISWD